MKIPKKHRGLHKMPSRAICGRQAACLRPLVYSLRLVKLHKNWECPQNSQENFHFLSCECYMYNYNWGYRTDTGLCEPSWSIRLNCQSQANLEMMHVLQAQVCGCISAYSGWPDQKTKRETISKSQLNQASWNRTVLKFGSENKLNVHNYCIF